MQGFSSSNKSNGYDQTSPHDSESDNAVGHMILNRYRILDVNESGGFGTVSICWDTRLQRRVAIKRMPLAVPGVESPSSSTLDEALGEARTAGMLTHPNIVAVHDFETDPQSSYLVMEYVDGLNLQELLARVDGGVLTYDECACVLQSIASALAFAHENRVLHLDIKPANIMIDRTGTVKLTDFGMATLASAAGYGGARGGTVGYMPPEQITGDLVDERSDVFSLAVVVWESLTGSNPFRAASAEESLKSIERGPHPTISKLEPQLAGIVEETLLRALDPDPSTRMSSVSELAQDIVPNLGNPEVGKASLADLVEQAQEGGDNVHNDEADPGLTPGERFPWLYPFVNRAAAASCTGILAYRLLPYVLASTTTARLFMALAIVGVTAAVPQLGSAIVLAELTLAVSASESSHSVPVALALLVVALAWWTYVGRHHRAATTALLLPSCTGLPLCGAAVAGSALTPLRAATTGLFAWFLCRFMQSALSCSFAPSTLMQLLLQMLRTPGSWIMALGCSLGALTCSLLYRRGGTTRIVVGQACCFGIVALALATVSHMENGGIWDGQAGADLALALVLGVIMCTINVLIGSEGLGPEGEDQQ